MRYGDCPGKLLVSRELAQPRAEQLLNQIDALINQQPVEQFVLVNQAASFTLIRVLATIGNALAFSRGWKLWQLAQPCSWEELPQHLMSPETIIKPHYSGEPRITISH